MESNGTKPSMLETKNWCIKFLELDTKKLEIAKLKVETKGKLPRVTDIGDVYTVKQKDSWVRCEKQGNKLKKKALVKDDEVKKNLNRLHQEKYIKVHQSR